MTRINCIPVNELSDQHLLAEYREIRRVSKLAKFVIGYNKYKMGEGHVKFFYNKGKYLEKRNNELYNECIKRGFNTKYIIYKKHSDNLNNDWIPSEIDMKINRERINEKLKMKPYFYRWTKK